MLRKRFTIIFLYLLIPLCLSSCANKVYPYAGKTQQKPNLHSSQFTKENSKNFDVKFSSTQKGQYENFEGQQEKLIYSYEGLSDTAVVTPFDEKVPGGQINGWELSFQKGFKRNAFPTYLISGFDAWYYSDIYGFRIRTGIGRDYKSLQLNLVGTIGFFHDEKYESYRREFSYLDYAGRSPEIWNSYSYEEGVSGLAGGGELHIHYEFNSILELGVDFSLNNYFWATIGETYVASKTWSASGYVELFDLIYLSPILGYDTYENLNSEVIYSFDLGVKFQLEN